VTDYQRWKARLLALHGATDLPPEPPPRATEAELRAALRDCVRAMATAETAAAGLHPADDEAWRMAHANAREVLE
jgi:hypothetical protein